MQSPNRTRKFINFLAFFLNYSLVSLLADHFSFINVIMTGEPTQLHQNEEWHPTYHTINLVFEFKLLTSVITLQSVTQYHKQ